MRVTNNMLSSQVVFNAQRSLQRFMDLQIGMSSGKRINKPSDDPVGTLRDLDYRTELSKISQFQSNVGQGLNWLGTYDGILADVKNLLSNAKDTALAMSNDTYDVSQRQASANEVQAVFDRIIQLTSTKLGGRQMFSGHRTKLNPFKVGANGVTYMGDNGAIKFEIQSQMRQKVNLTGAEVFLRSIGILGENADLNIGVADQTLLADLNGGSGIDLASGRFTITDQNLIGVSVTVDLVAAPPATTVGEVITRINASLALAGMDGTVSAEVGDDGNNIKMVTTATGEISTATSISSLREGQGIDLTGGSIHVSDGAGVDIYVDVSTATTIGDVITTFNTKMGSEGINNFALGINAAGTGFVVNDTNGIPLGLSIENSSADDLTAHDLGIEGIVVGQLVGEDLNPQVSISIAETSGTTASDLGIVGDYNYSRGGTDLNPSLTLTSNIADLRNGIGFDGDTIEMWQGEFTHTVDLSDPAIVTVQDLLDDINNSGINVTASLNASGQGIQIVNNDPNRSFTIKDVDGGRVAKQMDLYGSSDMMGSLLVLADALRNDDQEGINRLLANFDEAMTLSLETRASVGTNALRLEATASRLLDMELGFTKLLAEVEDADLTKLITDLASHENAYRASLMAAGKIIQPTLLDFLR